MTEELILGCPFLYWDEWESSQGWRENAPSHGLDPCALPQVSKLSNQANERANPRKDDQNPKREDSFSDYQKVKTRRKCPYTPAATMCHRKGREVIKLPTLWPILTE